MKVTLVFVEVSLADAAVEDGSGQCVIVLFDRCRSLLVFAPHATNGDTIASWLQLSAMLRSVLVWFKCPCL